MAKNIIYHSRRHKQGQGYHPAAQTLNPIMVLCLMPKVLDDSNLLVLLTITHFSPFGYMPVFDNYPIDLAFLVSQDLLQSPGFHFSVLKNGLSGSPVRDSHDSILGFSGSPKSWSIIIQSFYSCILMTVKPQLCGQY